MSHLFLTTAAVPPRRWAEAFPAATTARPQEACFGTWETVWVHLDPGEDVEAQLRMAAKKLPKTRIVAMSNEPNDEEGLAALSAGVAGYCNAHASPEVLHQIAEVIGRGGLWVGEALLARLLGAIAPHLSPSSEKRQSGMESLTEREREVSVRIARGERNKEIASNLNISERTVKAHLSAVFDKLGVRDRLQLALALSKPRT